MERFGILEMEFVADLHREQESKNWKFDAFHTILENDFNRIPGGWTVVFLRNTPVQIVPNALLADIKEMSIRGFMHYPEDCRFECLYDAHSEEGTGIFRGVIELVLGWLDTNM